jgi:hypothetical protein
MATKHFGIKRTRNLLNMLGDDRSRRANKLEGLVTNNGAHDKREVVKIEIMWSSLLDKILEEEGSFCGIVNPATNLTVNEGRNRKRGSVFGDIRKSEPQKMSIVRFLDILATLSSEVPEVEHDKIAD